MSRHEQQTPGKDPRFDSVRDTWYWKASKPLRVVVHFFIRMRNAYRHYGGLKGMWKRFLQKKFERKKRVTFGTASFPSEAQKRIERETTFSKDIKISILVPLFNTPEKFLREMIDSVQYQTYGNWEL